MHRYKLIPPVELRRVIDRDPVAKRNHAAQEAACNQTGWDGVVCRVEMMRCGYDVVDRFAVFGNLLTFLLGGAAMAGVIWICLSFDYARAMLEVAETAAKM